jgi:hypothetical protein
MLLRNFLKKQISTELFILFFFLFYDFVQFLFVSVNGYYIEDFLLDECKFSYNQLLFIFLMQAILWINLYFIDTS